MSRTAIHKKFHIDIQHAFLSLFLLILIVYILDTSAYQRNAQNPEMVRECNAGWTLSDGSTASLPARIAYAADGSIEIHNILPQVEQGDFLSVQTHAQRMFVYVDERETYRFSDLMPHGDVTGRQVHLISLPDDAAGKTIRIRFESEISAPAPAFCVLREIYCGSMSQLEWQVIVQNIHILLGFGISVIAALLLMIVSFLFRLSSEKNTSNGMIMLGVFILLAGFWMLTDSPILQLFVQNRVLIYYVSFLLFTMFPFAFLQYLNFILSKPRRSLEIYSAVSLIHCALVFLFDFSGMAPLTKTLPVTHLLLVGTVALAIVFLLIDMIRYKNSTVLLPCVGIGVLGLSALVSLFLFASNGFLRIQYSAVFVAGFLVFVLCVVLPSIGKGRQIYTEHARLEIYRSLALIDVMTGMLNRTAFDADMATVEVNIEQYYEISIAVLDINDLKACNDNYGHQVGDQMIQACADCIVQTLGSLGQCYRIGGDEFSVLFCNVRRAEIDSAMRAFTAAVETYNVPHMHKLSVAFGVATQTRGEGAMSAETPRALFKRADREMYLQKNRNKAPADLRPES